MSRLGEKLAYHFRDSSLRQSLVTAGGIIAGRLELASRCPRPRMLQIEVTNRCNINCTICSRSVEKLAEGDMAPELLEQVIELSADCHEVALFGYGEPLISKRFYMLIEKLRCGRIGFFTNGLALGADLCKKILGQAARPLSYIVFSVDGATAETYNRIRQGSDFDRVWKNLEQVAAICAGLRRPPALNIEFVAMRSNVAELPRLVEMADVAGVAMVKASHLVVWAEHLRDESLYYHPELCRRAFEAARRAAEGKRVRLDLPKFFGEPAAAPAAAPVCRYPWNYAMISYEGIVRACCFAPEFAMGSLREQSFDALWHSSAYRNLRTTLNTAAAPGCCLRCEERYRYSPSPDDELTYIKLKPREK